MLVAVTEQGRRGVASAATRGQQFTCPSCTSLVRVRVPQDRVPHFVHPPHANCALRLSPAARRAAARQQALERQARRRSEQLRAAGQGDLFELLVDGDAEPPAQPLVA